jgi:hypothetical protein
MIPSERKGCDQALSLKPRGLSDARRFGKLAARVGLCQQCVIALRNLSLVPWSRRMSPGDFYGEAGAAGSPANEPQPELAQPEPIATSAAGEKRGLNGKTIGAALAGLALLAAAGFSLDLWPSGSPTAPAAPPPVVQMAPAGPTQSNASLIERVAPADLGAALGALKLDESARRQASDMVAAGKVLVGTLTVFDRGSEDGDIVQISGAGFTQVVPLLKAPTRVTVLYVPGTPIKVFGYKDGKDPGITVSVQTGGKTLRLVTMKEGQTIEVAAP